MNGDRSDWLLTGDPVTSRLAVAEIVRLPIRLGLLDKGPIHWRFPMKTTQRNEPISPRGRRLTSTHVSGYVAKSRLFEKHADLRAG